MMMNKGVVYSNARKLMKEMLWIGAFFIAYTSVYFLVVMVVTGREVYLSYGMFALTAFVIILLLRDYFRFMRM